jgi:hypothetical protein
MERTDVKSPGLRTQALRSVFIMRDIPSAEAAPAVRSAMLDLLGIREQYREDGEEALHDGDEFREEAAQRYYDEYNERLHDEYAVYVNGLGAKAEGSKVLDSDISKTPEASPHLSKTPEASPHFVGIEELPLPVVHAHSREQIRENLDPSLPTRSSQMVSRLPSGLTSPLCPPTQLPFQIWFGFMEEDEPLTIWDAFPLATIYALAFAWVIRTFHGNFVAASMVMIRYAGQRYRDNVVRTILS